MISNIVKSLTFTLITILIILPYIDTTAKAQAVQSTEQEYLSGFYAGVVKFPDAALSGDAVLRIADDNFELTSGESTLTGSITTVKTRGYIAVAMQFNDLPGITPPLIISLRANRTADGIDLISVPGEKHTFYFSTIGRGGDITNAETGGRRGRRRSRGGRGKHVSSTLLTIVNPFLGTYTIPDFPWPPPKASAMAQIPKEFLQKPGGRTYLRDVSERLRQAFSQAGYGELSWYAVPEGFAVISRLEQFKDDGSPLEGIQRWSAELTSPPRRTLSDLLNILFKARKGHYRVIVFIVTPDSFTQSNEGISSIRASELLSEGANQLTTSIGSLIFSSNSSCTALIYEFEQASADDKAEFKYPGTLDGLLHLKQSGIWKALER